uniref:Uncharacterized protein n=1 Tax=Panagrolaimus sp. JU765 TaxID=591449 RepID=A0AC34Q874_9BILA
MSDYFDSADDDLEEFLKNLWEQMRQPNQAPLREPTSEASPKSIDQTIAVFNFEDKNFEENVEDVVPETIRNYFGINQNVNFELIRENVVNKVVGNQFEPALYPGNFNVRIIP